MKASLACDKHYGLEETKETSCLKNESDRKWHLNPDFAIVVILGGFRELVSYRKPCTIAGQKYTFQSDY